MVRVITIVLMIVLGILAPVIGMSLLILHLLPLHHVVIGVWRPLILFLDRLVSLLMKFTPWYHLHRSCLSWSLVLFPWIFPQ
ncbi:hypothetical protein GBA52_010493 [Prunus armeniaca]|nr:hypothetical protein GBA52_010493 [Prunus armeniaca]